MMTRLGTAGRRRWLSLMAVLLAAVMIGGAGALANDTDSIELGLPVIDSSTKTPPPTETPPVKPTKTPGGGGHDGKPVTKLPATGVTPDAGEGAALAPVALLLAGGGLLAASGVVVKGRRTSV